MICDDILAEMGKVRPHDGSWLAAGYLVLGAGFGILLRTRGFGLGWALAMSLFIYAGSMQYVAVDLLTGGASLLTAAVTTLLVNARHRTFFTASPCSSATAPQESMRRILFFR